MAETVIVPTPITSSGTSSAKTSDGPLAPAPAHWDGDFWVEADGRRIARKWVDNFPEFYGPEASDPDAGQGDIEVDDVISRWSARLMGVTYKPGYDGQFSNYDERHGFLGGLNIGLTLNEIEAVPTPSFWVKDAHYFKSGIAVGYALRWAKKYAAVGFAAGGAAGTAFGPQILQFIAKLAAGIA